jgi:hypothetical protein
MKRLLLLSALLLLKMCPASQAQTPNFATVTGSTFYGTNGQPLVSGTIIFQANNAGTPIAYQVGGGGQQVTYPIVCSISNGAIAASPACLVANTANTNPLNACFMVTVKDGTNTVVMGGSIPSGYGCAQPSQNASWCSLSGSTLTCNFDQFVPNTAGIPVARLPYPTPNALGGVFSGICGANLVVNGILPTGKVNCIAGGTGGGGTWGSITGLLSNQADLYTYLQTLAPLNSPSFTGTPLAPTAGVNTSTNQIATTAFVVNQNYAPNASPTFTGTPSAPTPPTSDSTTKLATTQWVNLQGFGTGGGNVTGPGSSLVGDCALFNATNGRLLTDCGFGFPLAPAHIGTLVAGSNGLANSATTDTTNAGNIISGTLSNSRLNSTISSNTTGNAATATALASTPTPCSTGEAAGGVAVSGNSVNCVNVGVSSLTVNGGSALTNPNLTSGTGTTVSVSGSNVSVNVNPASSGTVGGVNSIVQTSHNFLSYIDTAGLPHQARPVCGDLSDSAGGCSMSTVAAGDLNGTLPSANVVSTHITGGTQNYFPIFSSTGNVTPSPFFMNSGVFTGNTPTLNTIPDLGGTSVAPQYGVQVIDTSNGPSSQDRTINAYFGTGAANLSRHDPIDVQIEGLEQLHIGWQPGPQGETVIGNAVPFESVQQAPYAKSVISSNTPGHTEVRLFQASASDTAQDGMLSFNNTTTSATPGTFYFWTACQGAIGINALTTAAITSTGSQAVAVNNTTNMQSGGSVPITGSDGNTERVVVTGLIPGTSFTADFTKTHVVGSTIIQPTTGCGGAPKVATLDNTGYLTLNGGLNSGGTTTLNNVVINGTCTGGCGSGSPPGGTTGTFQTNAGSGLFGGVTFAGDMTSTSGGTTTVASLHLPSPTSGAVMSETSGGNITPSLYSDNGTVGAYAGTGGTQAPSASTTGAGSSLVGGSQGLALAPITNGWGWQVPESVPLGFSTVVYNAPATGIWQTTVITTPPSASCSSSCLTSGAVNSANFTFSAGSATSTLGYPHAPPCVASGGSPTLPAQCVFVMSGIYPNEIPASISITFAGTGYSSAPTFGVPAGGEQSLQPVTDVVEANVTPVVNAFPKWLSILSPSGESKVGNSNATENGTSFFPNNLVDLKQNNSEAAEVTTASGTYTAGNAACLTATQTAGNCTTLAAAANLLGVLEAKDGTAPVYAFSGQINVNSAAAQSWTAGDTVCTDPTNIGVFIDNALATVPNATGPCMTPSVQVGRVLTTDTSVTSHVIAMQRGTSVPYGTVTAFSAGQSPGTVSFCSTTACPVGIYKYSVYIEITTACTTSGTLSMTYSYTDDGGSKNTVTMPLTGTGVTANVLTTTATGNFAYGGVTLRSMGANPIQSAYVTSACGSGTLAGNLYQTAERIQWQ